MKTLSLKQPWAELILQGRKKIELRKWNTNFRGEFFIHASKIPDEKAMKKFGFNNLPCGFIVGKAKLVNVKKYVDDETFKGDNDFHLADNSFGDYGFVLECVKRIKKITVKGNLGFWNFDLK